MTPRDRLQRLLFEHRTAHDPASSEREILAMFDDLESATHDLTIAYMSGRYDERTAHTKEQATPAKVRLTDGLGPGAKH